MGMLSTVLTHWASAEGGAAAVPSAPGPGGESGGDWGPSTVVPNPHPPQILCQPHASGSLEEAAWSLNFLFHYFIYVLKQSRGVPLHRRFRFAQHPDRLGLLRMWKGHRGAPGCSHAQGGTSQDDSPDSVLPLGHLPLEASTKPCCGHPEGVQAAWHEGPLAAEALGAPVRPF